MNQQETLSQLLDKSLELDRIDPLHSWRGNFLFPVMSNSDARGNSLGSKPGHLFTQLLDEESDIWGKHGHDGHFFEELKSKASIRESWWLYDELFEIPISRLLGTNECVPEAVVCNSLSVNTYMMTLDFMALVRESGKKKIVTLSTFFNSDLESLKKVISILYGEENIDLLLIQIDPNDGDIYSTEYIADVISKVDDLGLVFIPAICHKTGQRFNMEKLAESAHSKGAYFGVDLAHAIGNIPLELSRWGVDYATFCGYKYLNGGPGGVGGLYVNKKHIDKFKQPSGWWGISSETRFGDSSKYKPSKGARRFISSNAPVFNMQGLRAYLHLLQSEFPDSLEPMFKKHQDISEYTYKVLSAIPGVKVVTPRDWCNRGCQISFRIEGHDVTEVLSYLKDRKVFVEDRGDVLRAAFVSYNTYEEVADLAKFLCRCLGIPL